LTPGRQPVVEIIAESLSQHDEKHVVPTPLSGIWVGKRRKYNLNLVTYELVYEITDFFFMIWTQAIRVGPIMKDVHIGG
jgi:hypothetical protein